MMRLASLRHCRVEKRRAPKDFPTPFLLVQGSSPSNRESPASVPASLKGTSRWGVIADRSRDF